MELSREEYFFYEWLIIVKQMTKEEFKRLTILELTALIDEHREIMRSLK